MKVTRGPAGLGRSAGRASWLALVPLVLVAAPPAPRPRAIDCFAAGTVIATAGGERRIEELSAGDLILCRDSKGNVGSCRLAKVTRRRADSVRRFVLDDGRQLAMAGDHLLRTATGWTPASELAVGTKVATRTEERTIKGVAIADGGHDVCDITPDGSGAFFANGILVHR